MTDLQTYYLEERMRGLKHRAAVDAVARCTGIDSASVARALARAKREDDRDAKRSKKEAKA